MIVLREAPPGVEVFCVLRHAKSSFLGGAVVFPGGKVDAADTGAPWGARSTEPHPRAARFAGEAEAPAASDPDGHAARALCVAACRETLEEGGIVPLDEALPLAAIEALRRELANAPVTMGPQAAPNPSALFAGLERLGRRLAIDALVPWARWITPEAESRRYDARFFLLELPPGQEGRHDDHETTMSFWASPSAVLDRYTRGEIFLAPPTTRALELLAGARDVQAAKAIAAEQSLLPICPLFVPDPAAPYLALPGDPSHSISERRVAGPTRFVLRDGRFNSEDPAAAPRGGAAPGRDP